MEMRTIFRKISGKHLVRIFGNMTLNRKLVFTFVVCVLLPLVLINLITFTRISENVRLRESENLDASMSIATKNIADYLNAAVTVSNTLSMDDGLFSALDRTYISDTDYLESYNSSLKSKLDAYNTLFEQFNNVKIYTNNQSIISGGYVYSINQDIGRNPQTENIKDSQWYNVFQNSKSKIMVYAYYSYNPVTSESNVLHISYLRRLDNYRDINFENILKIDYNIQNLDNILDQDHSTMNLYLIDESGNIVRSTGDVSGKGVGDQQPILTEKSISKSPNQLTRSIKVVGTPVDWHLVGISTNDLLGKSLIETRAFMIQIALISIVVSAFFIVIIYKSYNERISKLATHLKKVGKHEFDLINTPVSNDEIGNLIMSFNDMASQINLLVNDIHKLEIEKKDLEIEGIKAELEHIQTQMDPHFLYNTLNSMLVVSLKEGYPRLIEIIRDLSRLMRRLIGNKDSMVTLQEELSFTEMYLRIEKFRFMDRFSYSIEIQDDVKQLRIPKLTIQPLVENACNHGISAKRGGGGIQITAMAEGDFLCINVKDDGVGINSWKLAEIIQMIHQADDPNDDHIGIRNIYRRMRLMYGDSFDFQMTSEVDQGVNILMRIPLKLINDIADENSKGNTHV